MEIRGKPKADKGEMGGRNLLDSIAYPIAAH